MDHQQTPGATTAKDPGKDQDPGRSLRKPTGVQINWNPKILPIVMVNWPNQDLNPPPGCEVVKSTHQTFTFYLVQKIRRMFVIYQMARVS